MSYRCNSLVWRSMEIICTEVMRQLNEVRKSSEIIKADGTKYKSITNSYIWSACDICGIIRWVILYKGKPKATKCIVCAQKGINNVGAKSPYWHGGRHKTQQGYIYIRVYPDDFFSSMTNSIGYAFEHRLVMAKSLGRCLHRWEIVHHKNHIRDDNRLENLQLVSDDRHKQITILENRINFLESRVTNLESEIVLLKTRS